MVALGFEETFVGKSNREDLGILLEIHDSEYRGCGGVVEELGVRGIFRFLVWRGWGFLGMNDRRSDLV